jgi:hypothetical protein
MWPRKLYGKLFSNTGQEVMTSNVICTAWCRKLSFVISKTVSAGIYQLVVTDVGNRYLADSLLNKTRAAIEFFAYLFAKLGNRQSP